MKNNKAFTLVELMVVIAIIAILAVGSITGYNSYLEKTRDSKRLQVLATIVDGLRSFNYSNGYYPTVSTGTTGWYCFSGTDDTAPCSRGVGMGTHTQDLQFNNQLKGFTTEIPPFENIKGGIEGIFHHCVEFADPPTNSRCARIEFGMSFETEKTGSNCGGYGTTPVTTPPHVWAYHCRFSLDQQS